MTQAECDDLIDLYIEGELPEALHGFVETYLFAHPAAAREAAALQETVRRLQAISAEKPDDWFVERALDRLLREHAEADKAPPAPNFGGAGR